MSALPKPSPAVVKISPASHASLQEIAKAEHRPMREIVTNLIERYELEQFWKQSREAVERLRADPVAWRDYQDEARLLHGGSMDGLEDEPPYDTVDEEEEILAEYARSQSG